MPQLSRPSPTILKQKKRHVPSKIISSARASVDFLDSDKKNPYVRAICYAPTRGATTKYKWTLIKGEFQFTLPRGERPRGKYSEIFRGFEEGFLRSSSIAVTDGLYSKRRNWVSAYCSSRASNRQKSCVHHLRKQLSFHLPTYENPIQRPLHNARICCIVIDIQDTVKSASVHDRDPCPNHSNSLHSDLCTHFPETVFRVQSKTLLTRPIFPSHFPKDPYNLVRNDCSCSLTQKRKNAKAQTKFGALTPLIQRSLQSTSSEKVSYNQFALNIKGGDTAKYFDLSSVIIPNMIEAETIPLLIDYRKELIF